MAARAPRDGREGTAPGTGDAIKLSTGSSLSAEKHPGRGGVGWGGPGIATFYSAVQPRASVSGREERSSDMMAGGGGLPDGKGTQAKP